MSAAGLLLLDNSAFARLAAPGLPRERAGAIVDALVEGTIATSLPFLLEAGCSARSARDHGALLEELAALPRLGSDEEVERRALDAQAQLARAGHHRVPPVDVMIAALADRHAAGILHYDGDYDVIAARTDLRFESVWLAPRGSL